MGVKADLVVVKVKVGGLASCRSAWWETRRGRGCALFKRAAHAYVRERAWNVQGNINNVKRCLTPNHLLFSVPLR